MAEGRLEAAWDRTSAVLAMIYNTFRPADAKPLGPAKFNPYLTKPTTKPAAPPKAPLGVLKSFVPNLKKPGDIHVPANHPE